MTRQRKLEDYMKTIFLLQQKGDVHGADIADALHVSRPTVSVSLRDLETEGYLLRQRDRTVRLTEKGQAIAYEIAAKNLSLFDLLVRLGVKQKTAQEDACEMEHAISRESYHALMTLADQYLNDKEV